MYQLTVPNSPTALRLGSKFLADLAEQSETIRAELGSRVVGELSYAVKLDTSEAAASLAQLLPQEPAVDLTPTGGEPAPTPVAARVAELEQERDAALAEPEPALEVATPAPAPLPPEPAPEPELVYYAERAGGFTLEAMRAAGWSDDQLVAAGHAEWVTPAPKPDAPSASAPTPPAPPAAPVPPAPATSGAVELDKAGLPWDERIHSGTKSTVADGTWKKKRGVDASLVAQVEAELRGLAAPVAPVAPAATPAPATPAAPAAPAAAGDPSTFPELTQWLVGLTKRGVSPTDISLAIMGLNVDGVNSIPHLSGRPDLIPALVAKLKEKVPA